MAKFPKIIIFIALTLYEGIIRIVKVLAKDKIDYRTIEGKYDPETGKGKEFIGLNPYLDFEYSGEKIGCVFFKAHAFTI